MQKIIKFQKLLETQKSIVVPCVCDALSAMIAERVGFKLLTTGGFVIAATAFGLPDIGLLTLTEMVQINKQIINAVDIPIFADADNGFGGLNNVTRTVKSFEEIGAVGINLEDQVLPKRCGHLDGKEVISLADAVKKIEVAVKVRKNPNFKIIARTDARATHGLSEAIRRGKAFAKAGADVIFIEAPQTKDEIITIAKEIREKPLLINLVDFGKTPFLPTDELEHLGYKLIVFSLSSLLVTVKSLTELFRRLKQCHTTLDIQSQMCTFAEFKDLIRLEKFNRGF